MTKEQIKTLNDEIETASVMGRSEEYGIVTKTGFAGYIAGLRKAKEIMGLK